MISCTLRPQRPYPSPTPTPSQLPRSQNPPLHAVFDPSELEFINKGLNCGRKIGSLLGLRMPIWRFGPIQWINRKIIDPLMQIIKRGAEPKQLAFSTALGTTLGLFPICGVTVLLCGMAIALLGSRCHAPSVMLANFIATPLEFSLMIPFLRLGELISGGSHFPLTTDALKKVVTGHASREVLLGVFHALLGWLVASPFIVGALYTVLVPCFKYLVGKFSPVPLNPSTPRGEIKIKVRDV